MHDRAPTTEPVPAVHPPAKRPGGVSAGPPAPVSAQVLVGLQSGAGNRACLALLGIQRAADGGTPGVEPVLRRGSTGPSVKLLQDYLVQANTALAVDGIFGPITKKAVVAYQAAASLAADGIVGPKTWGSLRTGGVRVPTTPGSGLAGSDLVQRVVARLGTVVSYLAPLTTVARAPSTQVKPLAAHAAHVGTGPVLVVARSPEGGEPVPADAGGAGPQADGSVAASAASVAVLLAQLDPATAADLGPTASSTGVLVAGLQDGSMPLDQAVVQLDTVASQLGEFAANQAGKATGSGSTTVTVVSDTTFKITGDTIGDVGTALSARMSTHGEAASVSPHTKADGTVPGIEVSYDEVSAAGKVTKATARLELDRVLPEWTKASSTKCACWKKEWERFDAAIRAHEQEHVNIYTRFLTGLHLKFVGKTVKEADAIFDKVFKATEAAQAEFDTRTTHGQVPAPGTTFNAGTPCTC